MRKLNSSLFSSKDQTWETPQDLFDKLNEVFKFELDVCARMVIYFKRKY